MDGKISCTKLEFNQKCLNAFVVLMDENLEQQIFLLLWEIMQIGENDQNYENIIHLRTICIEHKLYFFFLQTWKELKFKKLTAFYFSK